MYHIGMLASLHAQMERVDRSQRLRSCVVETFGGVRAGVLSRRGQVDAGAGMTALITAWIILGLLTAVVVCRCELDFTEDIDLVAIGVFTLSLSCLLAWPLWWGWAVWKWMRR